MSLFIVEHLKVMPHPSVLLIHPFKQIWEEDETEGKDIALIKFSFVEFMCSYDKSNEFIGYELDERGDKILAAILSPNGEINAVDIKENVLVLEAINMYIQFQIQASPSIRLYEAALQASNKLVDFFDTLDMNERTKGGTPVYKPADITRALKDVNDVLKTLAGLKATIHQELVEATKGKGGRTINYFERAVSER